MKYVVAICIVLFHMINVPQPVKVLAIEPARQSIGKLEGAEVYV